MANDCDVRATQFLSRFVVFCSLLSLSFGILVLAGWAFHIQRLKAIVTGQVTIKANTAACFMVLGAMLWVVNHEWWKRWTGLRIATYVAGAIVSVVGLLSFLEYWGSWDLGIDKLLAHAGAEDLPGSVRPGLMSPITAWGFLLLPAAALLSKAAGRWAWQTNHGLAIAVSLPSLFGVLDFMLDPATTHTHIAPGTAVILFLLCFAVMFSRRGSGISVVLTRASLGGELARRLLPVAILIPLVIEWLRWHGQGAELLSGWGGMALMTVTAMVLLAGAVLWTAAVIHRADSARQAAEAALRYSASIVANSNDAVIGEDLDGIVTSWNPGAEAIYGYTAQAMIGSAGSGIVPAERRQELQSILRDVVEGKKVRHLETRGVRKDGVGIDVSLSISPIRNEDGRIVAISTIARDISETKQAEEKLRKASLYARNLIESSLDPLVTINRDGKITDVNRATEAATGVARERLVGTDFCDYFTVPERAREGYQRAFESGPVQDYPLQLRHRSGKLTEVLYNAAVFRDENGKVEGVFAAARDVTERNQSERALHESERAFRALSELVPQLVWMCTPDGLNVYFNQRWVEYTGLSLEEGYGRGWAKPFHADDQSAAWAAWNQAIATGDVYQIESRLRAKDGTYRWFLMRGVPLRDDAGKIVKWFGTCTDVDDLKKAQAELKELNEDLERRVSERTSQLQEANHELEAFTYSVSHDLRAPLRHISGFSKILAEDYGAPLPMDARHLLDRIQDGTRQMGQLVDDLLNLARVGRHELQLQVTGLDSLVSEVRSRLRPEYEDRPVEWRIGKLPFVECDPALITQVFHNLISNALKFSRSRNPAKLEIGQLQDGERPVIFVRDNGVGFNMKYANKLFGVFQRLHRQEDFEGTGVGLATVQRIVRKHGGCIWAEAELEKGATFFFTLAESKNAEPKSDAAEVGGRA